MRKELISKPTHELSEKAKVWDNAFKIKFQEPANFLTGLTNRLEEVASDSVTWSLSSRLDMGRQDLFVSLGLKGFLSYTCVSVVKVQPVTHRQLR
ncbi:10910_t:CDS:2 [Paraglomus brasilianum]|uniref:10910_t:CDS:1 n=1 Tax=Paraglomus brasilianum TaxID=144538 RepID=A0A9N9FNM6_9GLOM|nr:10910_t:CDS:2 [Paraglomus brasilianum]